MDKETQTNSGFKPLTEQQKAASESLARYLGNDRLKEAHERMERVFQALKEAKQSEKK